MELSVDELKAIEIVKRHGTLQDCKSQLVSASVGVKMQNQFMQQRFIKISSLHQGTQCMKMIHFKLLSPHSSLKLQMASGSLASNELREVWGRRSKRIRQHCDFCLGKTFGCGYWHMELTGSRLIRSLLLLRELCCQRSHGPDLKTRPKLKSQNHLVI